jgi:hypothetical protein
MKWPRRKHAPIPGHSSAMTGFVVGIAASIAANVLHAMEGPWTYPELVGAAFWPTALLISVEILTRTPWPRGWQWITTRFLGVGVVALVAAVLSYRHMAGLLSSWGEDGLNAYLGPLAVDGLMLISATALLAISRHQQPATAPAAEQPAPVDVAFAQRFAELAEQNRLTTRLEPITAPAPAPVRIPLGRRRARRTAGVAGRRRPAAPQPAADAEPLSMATRLELARMSERANSHTQMAPPIGYAGDPGATVKTPALNGHARSTTSAPLEKKRAAAKKPARKPVKRAGALDDATYDKAFRYWQAETSRGNNVSAAALGEYIGRSKATGGRLLQEFREKVSA